MTSDPTSSATAVGYAVRGVHPSPHQEDVAASVLTRSPSTSEQPAKKGDNTGYAGGSGKSDRGRLVNIRV